MRQYAVQVVETVTTLVDRLPPTVRTVSPSSPPPSVSTNASSDSLAAADMPVQAELTSQERHRTQAVLEMVNTERKYVSDLENMQKYANTIVQTIDQDTIHHLFPNLNKLLNFQRRVLIRFEGIAELPWPEQRWALPFLEMVRSTLYFISCIMLTASNHRRKILLFMSLTVRTMDTPAI